MPLLAHEPQMLVATSAHGMDLERLICSSESGGMNERKQLRNSVSLSIEKKGGLFEIGKPVLGLLYRHLVIVWKFKE